MSEQRGGVRALLLVSSQHSRTAGKLEKQSRPMQAAGLRKGQRWAVCEGAVGKRGGMEP